MRLGENHIVRIPEIHLLVKNLTIKSFFPFYLMYKWSGFSTLTLIKYRLNNFIYAICFNYFFTKQYSKFCDTVSLATCDMFTKIRYL